MNSSENFNQLPVTLLAGFLGSGKTTLLNYILKQNHGKRIAVIENEFGEIGIDSEFVIGADEDIFEMSNGCICCSIRGDLIETLNRLLERQQKFNYILIESTGLASSGPIAQAFLIEDEISKSLFLDGIVTLIDAKHISNNLNEQEVVWEQIAFANVILLNKADLVTEPEMEKLEKQMHQINPTAKVCKTTNAVIDLDQILDIGGFDLKIELETVTFNTHHHETDEAISSVSLSFPGHVDPDRLNLWLQMLLIQEGMNVFRAKGILNVEGSSERYLFQSVYMMFEGRFDKPWGSNSPLNKMVFIGQNLNPQRLEESLKNFTAA
ncbi:MAG: GTP-binding protein [Nitrospinaceae bacterium]|jgi:G3E family GTPase|nr:GTP-binding protein [Nitrospinaceae bacterium]MEE3347038.1 GTP-binding protein [Nitrospinota bacterium]